MNFFEHQEHARRLTRRLVIAFALAVIATIAAVDLALVAMFKLGGFSQRTLVELAPVLLGGAAVTAVVIGGASLYRIASLNGGGGVVAAGMGGVLVDADVHDPLRRRLRNVVEEMALASGVPVPEIYVLEHEAGINAFAAGYSPSDAAVAVTRGALERLDRTELQGVIAHEFSHILNGDMRLNIRLMGALFGILVLALAGRRVLSGMRFSRGGKRNGGVVGLFALALVVIGYVGQFFGRWIKAAVSRQREFLADASAVQFTRHPEGVAGALKKIAAHVDGARLSADAEEISHMLFGQGFSGRLFATHPPIEQRIRRIDPAFDPAELAALARELPQPRWVEDAEHGVKAAADRSSAAPVMGAAQSGAAAGVIASAAFDVERLIAGVGRPEWEKVLRAAALSAALPRELAAAARSPEWAPEALLRLLLDEREAVRERQLLAVSRHLGSDSETQVRFLLRTVPVISPSQRLYLQEIAFPALKRRPRAYMERFQDAMTAVAEADGRVDVFEYLLTKVVAVHLRDALNPRQAQVAGRAGISELASQTGVLLGTLAGHANEDEQAARAYRLGMQAAGIAVTGDHEPAVAGFEALDRALSALDELSPAAKERLLRAMLATVLADDTVAVEELELLRAACAALHLPLPLW